MSRIIAITNNKGGVGKSTTAASIGCILAQNYRVLLIDLDAQANLTLHLIGEELDVSVYDAFMGKKKLPIINKDGCDIVPASIELSLLDSLLAAEPMKELRLQKLLESIKGNYDYIILDCPPALGVVTQNAFMAATDILIPVNAEMYSYKGLQILIDFYNKMRQWNPALNLLGIVVTRWKQNSVFRMVDEGLKANYGEYLLDSHIRENVDVSKSVVMHKAITEFAPGCNAAIDYASLTKEIINKTQE